MWNDRDGEMGKKNGDRLEKNRQGTTTNIRAYRCSGSLGMGATTDLHGDFGFIWILCVSYYNINKITRCFKYQSWHFDNESISVYKPV